MSESATATGLSNPLDIFSKLIDDFNNSSAWVEFSVLLCSLLLAYGASRAVASMYPAHGERGSIWLADRPHRGALFPLLAVVLLFFGQQVVMRFMPVFWLRIALPVLLSLALIRFVARVLSKTFPQSTSMRLIERVFSWLAWGVAVLHSLGLLPLVRKELNALEFNVGKTSVSALNVIEGAISIGLMMVVVFWVASLFEQHVLNRWVEDLSMRKVAMNLTQAVLVTIGLLISLSWVGMDLTALSVMGGALGVGLGFGMQKIASNYVSGFLVLIERALRIGDNVRVDGFEGRITDIKTRFTVIRALNGRESIVPNETLITQRVENLTQSDRQFALSTTLVVGMDSDVMQVRTILMDAASQQRRVLETPAPSVQLTDFVEHGLQFTLSYYIADPENGQAGVRSGVNLAILEGLRAAGISLPVPKQLVQVERDAALLATLPTRDLDASPASGSTP